MAKLYGEIAAKSLLTLDKSFARANGQPLDASEVYYSLDAAKAYAATAQAYIGQKIVVIENGVVSHYSVNDEAGNLKELGSKPVADGTTIAIGEDGKITLANITDTEAVGTYNAVLVNGKLTWVKPSSTTVEGLNDLITALTGRVTTLEEAINGKAAQGVEGEEGYVPAVKGLVEKLADEVVRAEAAEKALGDRIDAIDFVDADELTDVLEPYAKSADVVAKTEYATDKKALEDEDAAIRAIAESARDSINTFLSSEDIDETVNTLKEIQTEIDKMTDATELATALSSKADTTYVNEELAKKQDVIADGTYATPSDVTTAKQEAINEAATAAAGIYATQTALGNLETALDERLDVLEAIDHTLYAKSADVATKDELKATDDKAVSNATAIENLTGRIDDIVAEGGEPNQINNIKVNNVVQAIAEDKSVNITVPTKVSDLTDDTGFDARITAAQNAADAAQGTANEAKTAAAQAQDEVDALETVVGGIQTTVTGHTTTIGDHGTRIGALEQADIAHATEYSTLNGIVSGHTEAIAKKADQTTVDGVIAKTGANETAIKTLNETTIPGINGEIAKKANSTDVYTKSEVNAITGTVAEGKTIVKMIEEAQSAATYDDSEVRGLIAGNTSAVKAIYTAADGETPASGVLVSEIARVEGLVNAEKSRAEGIEANHESRIAEMETFWAAADDPEGTIDKLAEIVNYINSDKDGALDMAADIQANTEAINAIYVPASGEGDEAVPASGVLVNEIARVEGKADANTSAIAAINNETTGILAVSKKYTDNAIASLPAATVEALGLVKYDGDTIKMNDSKQLYVAKVSTDILVQGTDTLILNGGSATA